MIHTGTSSRLLQDAIERHFLKLLGGEAPGCRVSAQKLAPPDRGEACPESAIIEFAVEVVLPSREFDKRLWEEVHALASRLEHDLPGQLKLAERLKIYVETIPGPGA